MIYLALTIIQSTAIFIVMKLFSRFRIDNWQAITVNYAIAALFGFVIYKGDINAGIIMDRGWFTYSLLLGITFISTFFIFALSAQKVGVALTSVASKMSVVIPVIAGLILLHEKISMIAATGVAIALLAFYLTLGTGKKSSFPRQFLILPLLLFIGNGVNDTLMKYTEHHFVDGTNDLILFLAVVFLTALVIGSTISLFRITGKKYKINLRNIIAGMILGLINFGSTYYILVCMGLYDSAVVFPLTNAGIVSLSTLAGFFFFREKLSLKNWIGIGLALIAILLIANA